MKSVDIIKAQLESGAFEFSRHAFVRSVERNISEAEIRESARSLELIEEYPADKYGPSSLFLGFTRADRPLHLQFSLAEGEILRIITLYEPDPSQWTNFRARS